MRKQISQITLRGVFSCICVLPSSPSRDCAELRSNVGFVLQGDAIPDMIAMSSGSQPEWTRVLKEECPVSSQVAVMCKKLLALFGTLTFERHLYQHSNLEDLMGRFPDF